MMGKGASPRSTSESISNLARQWKLRLKVLLGLVGAGFMLVAFLKTWPEARQVARFSLGPVVAAAGLSIAATLAAGRSWSSLLSDRAGSRQLRRDFYLAQPGKYVPGGFMQPLGQVGLARSAGVSWGSGSMALVVQAVCAVASATLIVSIGWLAGSRIPWLVRLLSMASLIAAPVLYRPVMSGLLRGGGRLLGKHPAVSVLPPQGRILSCLLWTMASQLAAAACFWLLLIGIAPDVSWYAAIPGFMAAWLAGFVLVPFPAGLGVREAVLLLVLTPVPAALVVGASTLQRVMVLLVEGLVLLGSRFMPL